MQTIARSSFTTVKTEGGLLPADLLQRIADGRDVEGLRPEDYHLLPGERLNEAINRAWNRCLGAWLSFDDQRRKLPEYETGTTLTRERWLLVLFQELGYGRLQLQRGGLQSDDGTPYPVSHVWEQTPIHLVTFRQGLDRRSEVGTQLKRSPHSMMQELLNRARLYTWGFISNGLQLRILRDNASLRRAAFIEFDLESMMTGELYAEFSLLWLVCHQSRVEDIGNRELGVGSGEEGGDEGRDTDDVDDADETTTPNSLFPTPSSSWLERWSKLAAEQGTRAMDALRDGVAEAITALGSGFLAQGANQALRARLQSGELSTQAYYQQLRRLVYRLIFLFVAEDRDLLMLPEATAEVRRRYDAFYSLRRVREMAGTVRGGPHTDVYRQVRLLFELLRTGYPGLGLPALGSFLFSDRSTPDLDTAELANQALLAAIRALSLTVENSVRRPVDYRNLDSEELGSIYESLLELHPDVNLAASTFALNLGAGSERKTTGSHYTPTPLVENLLDTALEPVVADRLARAKKGSREWGLGSRGRASAGTEEAKDGGRIVPGFDRVAKGDGPGGDVLPTDANISEGGTVRDDFADSAGVEFDPRQHRGGVRPGAPERVCPLSADRPGFAEGAGDTPDPLGPRDPDDRGGDRTDPDALRRSGEDAARVDSEVAGGKGVGSREWGVAEEEGVGSREWGVAEEEGVGSREWGEGGSGGAPYSLLPIPYSLPPTPYSLPEAAILSIKVCDGAMGSGHMLIGAGRRLAKHLARIRTGDEEPAPADLRAAMRDVVRHCLYGVDVNDMAVELCKVALWMETMEPGKPLSFLDAHIQCGNSLIGVTPGLDISEIPDDAFQPVTGDDRTTATGLRRRNKKEREGQLGFAFGDAAPAGSTERHAGKRAAMVAAIEDLAEEDVDAVAAKARSYEEYLQSTEYKWARWEADTWTAAFFWPIAQGDAGTLAAPTQEVLRAVQAGKLKQHETLLREVRRIAKRQQFFHWPLQFPDVFERENGGFDVMLMNPPWERIRPEADKFFAVAAPEVLARKQTDRNKLIEELADSAPQLYEAWMDLRRTVLLLTSYLKYSGKYPLSTTKNVNSYAVFQELALELISASGRSGLIVQSGIATDDINRPIFEYMISGRRLVALYDFENRNGLFPGVHRMMRFCLVTTTGSTWHQNPDFVAYATDIEDVVQRLREKRYSLSQNDIRTLSPNTGLLPMFRDIHDAELTLKIYRTSGVLVNENVEGGNPWSVSIRRLFSIYYDSERLIDASGLGFSPTDKLLENEHWVRLYEAKLFHQFDHRYASYIGSTPHLKCDLRSDLARSPALSSLPRYWLPESELQAKLDGVDWEFRYFLGFRDVTNASNERTCIAAVIPRSAPDDTIRLIMTSENPIPTILLLVANLNSFVLDFAARCTVASTHLSEYIAKELPVLSPAKYGRDDISFVTSRVIELTYTAWDLQPFARDCGYDGPPFRWDEARRFLLRCELDAAYFHLYGIERDDVDYILETFPIVKRKDTARHGEFRTKRVILEMYDDMADAMQGGAPYGTRLEPPPADRRVAHEG